MQPLPEKSYFICETTIYICLFLGSSYSRTPGLTRAALRLSEQLCQCTTSSLVSESSLGQTNCQSFVIVMNTRIRCRMLFQTLESETVPRRVKSLLGVTYSRLLLCFKHLLDKSLLYLLPLLSYLFQVCALFSMTSHRILPGYVQAEPSILRCKQNNK